MPQINSEKFNSSVLYDALCPISKDFVRSVSDPMCLYDFDCRILMVNESATKLFGSQSEDFFVGKSVLDFILPQDHPQLLESIKCCIDTQLANQAECSIRTITGDTLSIKTTSFILSNKDADPVALLSLVKNTGVDISKKDQGIEPAQKAQLYLDLLRHDISNKLQIIMSSAELLGETINKSTRSELVQNIIDSISSCKSIILRTEILENYASQPLKIEYLDAYLRSALYNLVKSSNGVIVNANIQVDEAAIICDEYITHLLENVLQNVLKQNIQKEKQIWLTLEEDNDGYLLSVDDNGLGIPSEIKNNGNNINGKISGIGLCICHALIEKYQGWIRIANRIEEHPEEGITVLVWFPKYNHPIMQDMNHF